MADFVLFSELIQMDVIVGCPAGQMSQQQVFDLQQQRFQPQEQPLLMWKKTNRYGLAK